MSREREEEQYFYDYSGEGDKPIATAMGFNVEDIEDRIRAIVFQKRIRVSEFFKDFDKLKSGFVSQPQFRRCVNMCGIALTNDESLTLLREYMDQNSGRVNYARFSDSIDRVFTTKDLEKNPNQSLYNIKPVLEATRAPKDLNPQHMDQLKTLLSRLRLEARIQGYVVKLYFKDFDLHNHGIVTRSQFLQNIPFRHLKEDEMLMILDRYQTSSGDVNYLKFHEELENDDNSEVAKCEESNYECSKFSDNYPEADSVENLLKVHLLKYRVKLDEGFRDYDPLRTGLITKNQFISALGAIKLPKTILTAREYDVLAEKYRLDDEHSTSRIAYMEFLRNINQVLSSSNLERFPQKKLHQHTHLLKTQKQTLGNTKEEQLRAILERIRHAIYTKRILLKPIFRDFDKTQKGTFVTNHVTKHRFERALAMLGINLARQEYDLLARKYDDLQDDTVNYIMFLDDIDEGHNDEPFVNKEKQPNFNATWSVDVTQKQSDYSNIIEDLLFKSYRDRVRIEEFMKDFDPLRSGSISVTQFRSGLTMAGIKLSDSEFQVLTDVFKDPTTSNSVKYREFCNEVDRIFTEKGLETDPSKEVMNTQNFLYLTKLKRAPQVQYEADNVRDILVKLRQFIETRRVHLKPHFQDFDKHNTGRISRSNFKQGLDKIFKFSHIHYDVLVDNYYESSSGYVNYLQFIDDIDQSETRNLDTYVSSGLKISDSAPNNIEEDVQDVMNEIKSQVKKNRIRLKEFFTDYDKLRHGKCTPQKFRTGISMAKLVLTAKQISLIEDYFRVEDINNDNLDMVSYSDFCEAVDTVFVGKNLEKHPRKKLSDFVAKPRYPLVETVRGLPGNIQVRYENTMSKIYYLTLSRQLILKPYFQDYDPRRKERVTKTQFSAVLDNLKLELEESESKALAEKYADNQGDVDYVSFCRDVESQAKCVKSWNPHF